MFTKQFMLISSPSLDNEVRQMNAVVVVVECEDGECWQMGLKED